MSASNELPPEDSLRPEWIGEISERDKVFFQAFQNVDRALMRVQEKMRQLDAGARDPDDSDIQNAKQSMAELHRSLDQLHTAALSNPALQPFASRVTAHAREISQKMETLTQEEFQTELEQLHQLYERIKNL